MLYNVVLRPLPYPDADRLVKVYLTTNTDRRGAREIGFSYPKFEDLKRANTAFDSMAAYALRTYAITAPGPAELVRGEIVSASYFPMIGITAALGRTFVPEEDGEPGLALTLAAVGIYGVFSCFPTPWRHAGGNSESGWLPARAVGTF